MDKKILSHANYLRSKIDEIDTALRVFDTTKKGNAFVSGIFKIENTMTVKLMGKRTFGVGHHDVNVIIPNTMFLEIVQLFKEKKEELEKEFASLCELKTTNSV